MRSRSAWLIPLVASLVFAADHVSKLWALSNLSSGVLQPFLPPLLGLTLVHNTGAAFGMWRSQKFIMAMLPPLICMIMIIWIVRREKKGDLLKAAEQVGFGMILGGALGNIVDRILRGDVTDFLYFPFWTSFPVFNVADALIDAGVAIILLQALFARAPETVEPRSDKAGEPDA